MIDELKKGNLIFLKSTLVDLIYVVKEVDGEWVVARKIDDWGGFDRLPLQKVVKLADVQEKLIPDDVKEAIEEQRKVIFAQPKKRKVTAKSLDKLMASLPKEDLEKILEIAARSLAGDEEGGEGE